MIRFAKIMLPCLLTAQLCYSYPDSVTVPIKAIYAANATADSLDECKEMKDSLTSAIKLAKKTIIERDTSISQMTRIIFNLNEVDQNSIIIIHNQKAEIKKAKTKGWLKMALGILIGLASYPILK